MLASAAAHYVGVGRTQALADFTARKAPFSDRDLYVICVDRQRVFAANGRFPALVGVSADVLKDEHLLPLGDAMWTAVAKTPRAVIRYGGMNPVSRRSEMKRTFLHRLSEDVCGVGVYDPR